MEPVMLSHRSYFRVRGASMRSMPSILAILSVLGFGVDSAQAFTTRLAQSELVVAIGCGIGVNRGPLNGCYPVYRAEDRAPFEDRVPTQADRHFRVERVTFEVKPAAIVPIRQAAAPKTGAEKPAEPKTQAIIQTAANEITGDNLAQERAAADRAKAERDAAKALACLLYTSPSPRDGLL